MSVTATLPRVDPETTEERAPTSLGLVTDHYELTMAASYLERGMVAPATFSLFVRSLPPSRGFAVAAGLEHCLRFVESYGFDQDDAEHLRGLGEFSDDAIEQFAGLRFTGDVWAVPEGTVVFPDEPILEVTAPLPEAQLLESYLLNQVTLHTTLTTKAARLRLAAGDDAALVDFSMRRTHGLEASLAVARGAAIAGFDATSNVHAARRLGLASSGTMAHSYIEAFPDEIEAFRTFAEDTGGPVTLLVDTYDTLDGVRHAVAVWDELGLEGPLAVRLDSGDLGGLAKQTRPILDEAGYPDAKIFASSGLDEYEIRDLRASGAPIDGFGPGTNLGVSKDAPVLETVYKLVAYDDEPVMKLSSGKRTAPGAKQVYRRQPMAGDLLALRHEHPPPYDSASLLEPVVGGGRRERPPESLDTMRTRLRDQLSLLPDEVTDLDAPRAPEPEWSAELTKVTDELRARLEST